MLCSVGLWKRIVWVWCVCFFIKKRVPDTDPETRILSSDDAIGVFGDSDSKEVTQFVGNLENKQEAIQEYVEALKLLRMELLPEDIFNAMHTV